MVHSLTALRTRIRQVYGVEATKIGETSLLVKGIQPRQDDIALYGCLPSQSGYIFTLDTLIKSGLIRPTQPTLKPLPYTLRAFLLACLRLNLHPSEYTTPYKSMAPSDIFTSLGIPSQLCHYSPHNSLIGTYRMVTLKATSASILEQQLLNLTYALYDSTYYFLFCTSRMNSASDSCAEALTTLASAIINDQLTDDLLLTSGVTWGLLKQSVQTGDKLF